MTILRNRPSLIITLSVSAADGTQTADDVRSTIGNAVRVTWLTDTPARLLESGHIRREDEVGLLAPVGSNNRGNLATAVRNAIKDLRADKRELSTVSEGEGTVWDHADLLAKGGCSSVLQTRQERSKGWLRQKNDSGSSQPARGRFGLWIVPVTRQLSTRKDVAIANRQLEADLGNGLAHWSITLSSQAEFRQGLTEIARSIEKLVGRNKISLTTVQEFTAAKAIELRSQAAVSILRKAA